MDDYGFSSLRLFSYLSRNCWLFGSEAERRKNPWSFQLSHSRSDLLLPPLPLLFLLHQPSVRIKMMPTGILQEIPPAAAGNPSAGWAQPKFPSWRSMTSCYCFGCFVCRRPQRAEWQAAVFRNNLINDFRKLGQQQETRRNVILLFLSDVLSSFWILKTD